MRRPAAIATVLALFAAGVVVGVFGTHLFYAHHMRQARGFHARMLAADLQRRLDLKPEQQKQVDAILSDSRIEAMALRREMGPRIAALIGRAQARIEAILSPEQRREFESYRKDHDGRLRHLLLGAH
jgi:hypothetical protein